MAKKASANMWWIIIGAVIALVVMIILMVMFTGKTQPLEQGLSDCEGKGGVCVTTSIPGAVCPKNTFSSGAFDCPNKGSCCIGAPKKCTDLRDTINCGKKEECTDYGSGYFYCAESLNP